MDGMVGTKAALQPESTVVPFSSRKERELAPVVAAVGAVRVMRRVVPSPARMLKVSEAFSPAVESVLGEDALAVRQVWHTELVSEIGVDVGEDELAVSELALSQPASSASPRKGNAAVTKFVIMPLPRRW